MTQPTHTHRESGGKFSIITECEGTGPLHGKAIVIFCDLKEGHEMATTHGDWKQGWREIAPDDCSVCMGTGSDHIKNNKEMPCGGCYGLGKVLENGERPADLWELATVATGIIERQREQIAQMSAITESPAVQALLEQQHQQTITDSMGRQYQEWSGGQGAGPGGQRYTGD